MSAVGFLRVKQSVNQQTETKMARFKSQFEASRDLDVKTLARRHKQSQNAQLTCGLRILPYEGKI